MKTMVKAGLIAVLVGGAIALPAQEAGAAAACRYENGPKVCGATNVHHPRTVCKTTYVDHRAVKTCHKVY